MPVHIFGHVLLVHLLLYPFQHLSVSTGDLLHPWELWHMIRAFWCSVSGNTVTTKRPGWYFLHTIPSTVSSSDQSWEYRLSGGCVQFLCGRRCSEQLLCCVILLLCLPDLFYCEASMHCGQGYMECFHVRSSSSRQCICISIGRSLSVHDFKAEFRSPEPSDR